MATFVCPQLFGASVSTKCVVYPNAPREFPYISVTAKDLIDYSLTYDIVNDLSKNPPPQYPFFIEIQPVPVPAPEYVVVKDPSSSDNFDRLIGVALDGVPIYSALSNNGNDVLAGKESLAVDKCGGSYGQTPSGWRYHYRTIPSCIYDSTNARERRQLHVDSLFELLGYFAGLTEPVILGYSLTGYPIYSPYDTRGLLHSGLDNCNGKFVNGSYGYYSTPHFPYIAGCDGPGVYSSQDLAFYQETLPAKANVGYSACPRGTFPSTSSALASGENTGCISCPAGKYSTRTSNDAAAACNVVCPMGSYCPIASTKPILCAGGRYGSSTGLGSPECSGLCAEGYYCPAGSKKQDMYQCGNVTYYCPSGSINRVPVDEGYYTTPLEAPQHLKSSQTACGAGSFCSKGVRYPCPAGKFSELIASTSCTVDCPSGHFCPVGSIHPVKCPAGRYGSTTGLFDNKCSGLCNPGYFCPAGSTTPYQHPCPAGRYGAEAGLISEECSPICEIGGGPNSTSSEGTKYCQIRYCESGYVCPLASTSSRQKECGSPNVFCPPESAVPTNVALGYYSVGAFSSQYLQVDKDMTTRTAEEQCEPGFWCFGGIKFPCPPGYFGSTPGLVTKKCSGKCSPGFICPQNSISSQQMPCGHNSSVYCPQGSFQATIVPVGYYSVNGSTTTRSAIEHCPPGMYCTDGVRRACPAGRYSPYGSTSAACEGYCSGGFYCPEKSTSPKQKPCPAGRYGLPGATSSTCSGACLKGYYCPSNSTTPYERECGGEYVYCPHGSGHPLPVTVNHYSTGGNATTRFAQAKCELDLEYTGTPPASNSRSNVCPSTTVLS